MINLDLPCDITINNQAISLIEFPPCFIKARTTKIQLFIAKGKKWQKTSKKYGLVPSANREPRSPYFFGDPQNNHLCGALQNH